MNFLNIPLKSTQVSIISSIGVETAPWYNPIDYPVVPPALPQASIPRDYKWRVIMNISTQSHSSYLTRAPGSYNGQDISVGQWIANLTTGQTWQIISIESKTDSSVTAVVQDVYRYNTFRDPAQSGNGAPLTGTYVVFTLSDSGNPLIDPVPAAGTSAAFGTNLQSRFDYINLQYNYPLYQDGNTFSVGDIIAANSSTNTFVLSSSTNRVVVGRVTSVSDTEPGWFTVNPVQKIVDFLDYLPGQVGDILYASTTTPGEITVTPGGTEVYVKLKEQTSSVSQSTGPGPTAPGNVFQLNGANVVVGGTGTASDLIIATNLVSGATGVSAVSELFPSEVATNTGLLSPTYGEIALWASSSPATAAINGVTVTFNIVSTDPGYEDYARAPQMAQAINNAMIPGIVAEAPALSSLAIVNNTGGAITIANGTNDVNGVPFAGTASGSGLALSTPASTFSRIAFTAVDARPIDFVDVLGSPVNDFGLVSVENGDKAAGLYIAEGLRTASSTVVMNLTQLYSLSPLIGDTAYVIDSDDGNGNNVGEWSMWLFDGSGWVETSNQDSASTDAKSLEYTVTIGSPSAITVGKISTGRRVALITVEVSQAFNGTASLQIGYQIDNPVPPAPVPDGLMRSLVIDLNTVDTYTTYTDILFGTDTVQGDVTVTADFVNVGNTEGIAQIIVSYL